MRRHPRCGCDCRHNGGPNPNQYACCSECPDGQAPIIWHVYVPCDVLYEGHCLLGAGGGRRISVETGSDPIYVYGFPLAPQCSFDNCRWLAFWRDEVEGINSSGDGCPGQYTTLLTVFEPETEYSVPSCGEWGVPQTTYPDDFAWEMTIVDGVMSMAWDHPTYGLLKYESSDPVDCNGNNTLSLVETGTAKNLPAKLCIYPTQDAPCCCDGASSGGGCFVVDPCYEDPADRCACCDKCCEDLPVTVKLNCSGVQSTYSGNATTGGRTGTLSPAGPSREFCFTHSGHEICIVFYCDGTTWQRDVYCDGTLEDAGPCAAHTCCPLQFAFTFSLTCVTCEGCGCAGLDCTPCDFAVCCEGAPSTLYLTITTTDSGLAAMSPMTLSVLTTDTSWESSGGEAYLECADGTYTLTFTAGGCTFTATATTDCDLIDLDLGTHTCSGSGGDFDASFVVSE